MLEKDEKDQKKDRYLRAVAKIGTLTAGCKAARVSPNTVYKWREFDNEFVLREHQAREECADELERIVLARARAGSDTLAIFMLKALRPEKYRDRHDVTTGGQPIQQSIANIDDAIDRRLAELAAGSQGTTALAVAGSAEPDNP